MLLALFACAPHTRLPDAPPPLALEVSPALAAEEPAIRREIAAATDSAVGCLGAAGFDVSREGVLGRARIFATAGEATAAVAAHFGVDAAQVPASFAGTVDGDVLLAVSHARYREIFAALYPGWTWRPEEWRGLLTHEITHRVHARLATRLVGSEEGMGPGWFFEGLALHCAGQLVPAPGSPRLPWSEMEARIARAEAEGLSYVAYAEMFESMVRVYPLRELVERAGGPGLVVWLEEGWGGH